MSIQLQKTNSTLVTIGYSFGDDHINNIIFQNLINQDFTLIAFADVTEDKCMSIQKQHLANQNLHIIGGDIKNEEDINKAHYFNCILKNFMELEENIDE